MGKITGLVFLQVFCGFRVGGVLYWESLVVERMWLGGVYGWMWKDLAKEFQFGT
jgi:hypothetical protein